MVIFCDNFQKLIDNILCMRGQLPLKVLAAFIHKDVPL